MKLKIFYNEINVEDSYRHLPFSIDRRNNKLV